MTVSDIFFQERVQAAAAIMQVVAVPDVEVMAAPAVVDVQVATPVVQVAAHAVVEVIEAPTPAAEVTAVAPEDDILVCFDFLMLLVFFIFQCDISID